MMAFIGNEAFFSIEAKIGGSMMTVEEERDYYRQRFQSMKLVSKELQQQLAQFKTRCSGVNTVALMLKESKQEVMKLTKQHKALETAVANLQNRLSTNGLSSSVTIEETELFVPGASKQILDNLAKENARLRTLLKSHEVQTGKKLPEDVQRMMALVQTLEAENNQLRAQLLEMGHLKLTLASRYENEIEKINNEHKVENLKLEEALSQHQQELVKNPGHNNRDIDIERHSKAVQTADVEPSQVDEVRQTLRLLSDQCIALDQSLENAQIATKSEMQNKPSSNDNTDMVSKEAVIELEQKVTQVIQMNQRWRAYNENQEQQIHGLIARIAELEELCKEAEVLKSALESKDLENLNFRREVGNLNQDINKLRSQPQFDMSLVEILKQQIQVCTEDFNTERKDREHAINRAKQLIEEVNKLSSENVLLKRDIDNLQKIRNTSEVPFEKRENLMWRKSQLVPQFSQKGGPVSLQRLPFSSSSSGTSQLTAQSLSPVPSPVPMSFSSSSSVADRSSLYSPSSQDSVTGFQTHARAGFKQPTSHFINQASLPRARGPQEGMPDLSISQKPATTSVSMPGFGSKTEGFARNRQPDLTCPKCSKEFTENQQSELINHINSCRE